MVRSSGWARVALVVLFALACSPASSARQSEPDRMAWWREARFGLFIHWGLYAIPAGEWGGRTGYGEWILHSAQIPVAEYERFRERFDPVAFDADAWAALAAEAGMRYVVITSKHHDGFCLFDSELTDWDVMSTPFQRDILAELAEACRRQGLQMCWYHSIMDWHHPDYLPRRPWEDRPAEGADFDRYVGYLRGQVRELLTRYGPIGVMWFDGEWEGTWDHARGQALYDLCRELQPDVIVNNRVDKGRGGMAGMTSDSKYAGDFGTPEQEVPTTGFPGVDWESCMTMNHHWGYNARDLDFKSTEELVRTLVDIASKGGNFLLNVGPKADGTFPETCVERLRAIGRWMRTNGEAIHGTTASPFPALPWGRCTVRAGAQRSTLYLHVFDWPADGRLVLPGLGNAPLGARLLAAPDTALELERDGGDLAVRLPARMPDAVCSVVALEVEGPPLVFETPRIVAEAEGFVHRLEVRLEVSSPALELRYTLDGADPGPESTRYAGPFELAASATVKARAFYRGRAVSAVAARRIERVEPLAAVAPAAAVAPGLACAVYAGDWDALPDFDALTAEERAVVPDVRPYGSGEGRTRERYGLRLAGWIEVPARELWTFGLDSDDGARLYVHGRLVVDNDGLHGPTELTGSVALDAGRHPIVVEWFNKTGGAELALRWRPVGGALEPVPAAALSHAAR